MEQPGVYRAGIASSYLHTRPAGSPMLVCPFTDGQGGTRSGPRPILP